MNATHSHEKGQILVIFVAVLVALLGLTALAIDGGMIFADRRFSQSAADASALAGGGLAAQTMEASGIRWNNFSCSAPGVMQAMSVAYEAAQNRAISNQFSDLDNDINDNHGIYVECTNDRIHFDRYLDVYTYIRTDVSTAFAHLFYDGPFVNKVKASTRVRPRSTFAFGYAIASLSQQCGTKTGGVDFVGTSDVIINGGGVFSNSCITGSGSVQVGVSEAGIEYVGSLTTNGGASLSPTPVQAPATMPGMDVPTPNCGNGAAVSSTGGGTISPGNYSQIRLNNGELTMQPGLYCLTGDATFNGGTVYSQGVTIYMKKDGNKDTSFSVGGNVTGHFNAADSNTAVNGAIPGILIYMAKGNEGEISLQGNSGSSFFGAVYGPDATIEVGGTSGINPTYNTQLVGKYVKVHGTAQIEINFNNFEPYTTNPNLDLMH